jgi:hypothetical protein
MALTEHLTPEILLLEKKALDLLKRRRMGLLEFNRDSQKEHTQRNEANKPGEHPGTDKLLIN